MNVTFPDGTTAAGGPVNARIWTRAGTCVDFNVYPHHVAGLVEMVKNWLSGATGQVEFSGDLWSERTGLLALLRLDYADIERIDFDGGAR